MAALSPFSDFLINKKVPKILAALIPYILVLAFLVLIIFPIVPFFISQVQLLFKTFPNYVNQVAGTLNVKVENISNFFTPGIDAIGVNALTVTGKIFSGVFSTLTVLVISFYLSLGKNRLKDEFVGLFPANFQKIAKDTTFQIEKKLGAWFRGQLALSLTIGVITWISLTILGLPFAIPLALLAGILEILPTVGPIISAIPAVIVALAISPTTALYVVILYTVIQTLENNILVPKIMEKAVGLNPIVIIIGVLIGSKFLGILGALLAVPFISTLVILFKNLKPQKS